MTVPTNSFAINGTAFSKPPTEHGWVNQSILGTTGDGHPIYPAFRSYEMSFDFQDASEFSTFQGYFNALNLTGTASIDLPEYGVSTYQFRTYSGCVINQPEYDEYFEGYYQGATITVNKIRTA